jgi:hypothetical protein
MKNDEPIGSQNQAAGKDSLLEEIIREGARKVLQAAIEHEVRAALPRDVADRLARLGLLGVGYEADAAELEAVRLDIVAVQRLQAWTERELAAASRGPGAQPPRAKHGQPGTARAATGSAALGEAA